MIIACQEPRHLLRPDSKPCKALESAASGASAEQLQGPGEQFINIHRQGNHASHIHGQRWDKATESMHMPFPIFFTWDANVQRYFYGSSKPLMDEVCKAARHIGGYSSFDDSSADFMSIPSNPLRYSTFSNQGFK